MNIRIIPSDYYPGCGSVVAYMAPISPWDTTPWPHPSIPGEPFNPPSTEPWTPERCKEHIDSMIDEFAIMQALSRLDTETCKRILAWLQVKVGSTP